MSITSGTFYIGDSILEKEDLFEENNNIFESCYNTKINIYNYKKPFLKITPLDISEEEKGAHGVLYEVEAKVNKEQFILDKGGIKKLVIKINQEIKKLRFHDNEIKTLEYIKTLTKNINIVDYYGCGIVDSIKDKSKLKLILNQTIIQFLIIMKMVHY